MRKPFDDIFETTLDNITFKEYEYYKNKVKEDNGTLDNVTRIVARSTDKGEVELSYETSNGVKFERIRRVTGYLSEVRHWNDGKREELYHRTKHS